MDWSAFLAEQAHVEPSEIPPYQLDIYYPPKQREEESDAPLCRSIEEPPPSKMAALQSPFSWTFILSHAFSVVLVSVAVIAVYKWCLCSY
jgi:hypothetical protein